VHSEIKQISAPRAIGLWSILKTKWFITTGRNGESFQHNA